MAKAMRLAWSSSRPKGDGLFESKSQRWLGPTVERREGNVRNRSQITSANKLRIRSVARKRRPFGASSFLAELFSRFSRPDTVLKVHCCEGIPRTHLSFP